MQNVNFGGSYRHSPLSAFRREIRSIGIKKSVPILAPTFLVALVLFQNVCDAFAGVAVTVRV